VSVSPDRLKSLTGCGDAASLRSAVSELCAEFGKLMRIEIITIAEAEKRRALCFLRLESQAQESELMASLGVFRFGDDVLVIVDLPAGSPPAVNWLDS
jgi:mannose/fructose-specific phosphotransferase system component IIA